MKARSTNSTTTRTSSAETPAEREKRIRRRLKTDYRHYARKCLKVVPLDPERSIAAQMAGQSDSVNPVPFVFNRAQRYLDVRAEDMQARLGYVRIIGLKGRKQGFSTYVSGRGVWRSTNARSFPVRTMTHKIDSTDTLFDIVKGFYDNLPPLVKPTASNKNAKELKFDKLDSGFKVFTAGGDGSGRGDTARFFHWSEVAFSPNPEANARGALQCVPPRAKGTEKWLESTSDGPGNYFHRQCMDAIAGKSEYEFVFVPWYWQEEYRAEVPDGFVLLSDEAELLAVYGGIQADGGEGMTLENIVWRRLTIAELGGVEAFTREYPNSAEEAFAASAGDKLVNALLVQAAKGRDIVAALVRPLWGLDPARKGKDSSALCKRIGNVVPEATKSWAIADTMGLVGKVVAEYRATPFEERPSHIVVDSIGIGGPVADRLREVFETERTNGLTWADITEVVDCNVAETVSLRDPDRYAHVRDELAWLAREWFEAKNCRIPADDEPFVQEICAPAFGYTSGGKIKVEDKDKTKKTLGRSPDRWDSLVLTFFVSPQPIGATRQKVTLEIGGDRGGSWQANW